MQLISQVSSKHQNDSEDDFDYEADDVGLFNRFVDDHRDGSYRTNGQVHNAEHLIDFACPQHEDSNTKPDE